MPSVAAPARAAASTRLSIYAASLGDGFCNAAIVFLVPLHVHRVLGENSYALLAALVAVPALVSMLASNLWGALADTLGRYRPLVVVGLLGHTATFLTLAVVGRSALFLAVAALGALVYAALTPILRSYATLIADERRGRAVSTLLLWQSAGWTLGTLAASRAAAADSALAMRGVLVTCGVVAAVAAIVAAFNLRSEPLAPARVSTGARTRLGRLVRATVGDLVDLYETPALLSLCGPALLAYAGNWVFFGLFTMWYTEWIRGPVAWIGPIVAASTLAGVVAYPFVGRLVDRVGARRVLLGVIGLYVVNYAVLALIGTPLAVALVFIVPIYPALNTSLTAAVAELARPGQRGGGMGMLGGTYFLGIALGAQVGGLVADRHGLALLPWLASGFAAIALVGRLLTANLARPRAPKPEGRLAS